MSDPTPNVSEVISYDITLTNQGPSAATNVNVTDLLPAGLTFVSATPSQGVYSAVSGLWNVGTVANGADAVLQIQALVVSADPVFNSAVISGSDQFDPDLGNNSAGVLETPQQADVSIAKSVSNPTPNVGDTVTYTILVTNNGPDTATGVTVEDDLPPEVAYLSSMATVGFYDSARRIWVIGTLPVGETRTLTITATVVSPNPESNTATITHADQFDPDLANNSATASVIPQEADLELGKTVSNPTPNVGQRQ